jgi:hypothetical protein
MLVAFYNATLLFDNPLQSFAKMKYILTLLMVISIVTARSQSETTENLHKKNKEALSLFFYHNTLRMLNQKNDPEFDALIKDIEKMKFLMIDKKTVKLDYPQVVRDYKSEKFEEVMTSRHDGKSFDVYIREKDGKTKAMLVLINDESNLYVLDILGSIALNQVTKLYNTLDDSADIGQKIKAFTDSQSHD